MKMGFMLVVLSLCGTLIADVNLVKDGKALGAIILQKNATSGEKNAAAELKKYFAKISGTDVPICEDKFPGSIILGTVDSNNIPPALKLALEGKKDESFLIRTLDGNVYIVGKTQVGTLYGACTLLEEILNVRWFLPGEDEEYVEKRKDIAFPELHLLQEPAFNWRKLSQTSYPGKAIASKTWAARKKLQCTSAFTIRALTDPEQKDFFDARIADQVNTSGGHLTFYLAVPPQKYLKTNPEYFALVNGKRLQNNGHHNTHHCMSNETVQKMVADHICSLHEKHGKRITYLFGAPDSDKDWCECPNCKALDDGEKLDVSRRFHLVSQKIAKMVYEKHPDANLEVWAYANYRSIPKGVQIDPRMRIYFCSHNRCFSHAIDDPTCRRNVDILSLINDWLMLNPRMRLYEYAHCTPMHWSPLEHVLAKDLKTFQKMGIEGWKEEISFPDSDFPRNQIPEFEDNPVHHALLLYSEWLYWNVASRLAWNPDLDVDEVIADIESKYYGKAFLPMQAFNNLRRSIWANSNGCFGYPLGDSRTPVLLQKDGLREKLLSLLQEAEKLARNDPVLAKRIARDKTFFHVFWCRQNDAYRKRQGFLMTSPVPAEAPLIDGNPDDPVWAGASYVSDFQTAYTSEKKNLPPELKTTIGILSDERNLYFLIIAKEPDPTKLRALALEDKNVWDDDSIEIFLDPRNNANAYYQIVVNSRGSVFDARQAGNDSLLDFGVTAVAKVEKDRYIIELKVPVEKMEGEFKPGMVWNVHFARNRTIEDSFPKGHFSIDGEGYHQRSSYRTLIIGSPLIVNGNFDETDPGSGKLKAWTLNEKAEAVKSSGATRKNNILLQKGGLLSQLLWDWKGPLGQSPEERRIQITFRASGEGNLALFFPRYHDNWDSGKLQRKHFPSDMSHQVTLTPDMRAYSLDYTIKSNEWIGLFFHALGQKAEIENVSIVLK